MELPNRKLPRLKNYDYSSQNFYYVTICTHDRQELFVNTDTNNVYRQIAEETIHNIPLHFDGVKIDKYVVMSDHIHLIVIIGCDGITDKSRKFSSLSVVIGSYKSAVSKQIHKLNPNIRVWQPSFNDHIIRNKKDYLRIWQYIDENQLKSDLKKFENVF